MKNTFSTCVDNRYLPLFVSFYNSYKHYEHKTQLTIYDVIGLNTFNIQFIKKYANLKRINFNEHDGNNYFGTYAFKYHALLSSDFDNEVLLDLDVNFLNNIDWLFEPISKGKLVLAREGENWVDNSFLVYFKDENIIEESKIIKNKLLQIIGDDALKFNKDYTYKNYNGGILGFNKKLHSQILKESIEILYDTNTLNYYPFKIDQFALAFLADIKKLDIEELPQQSWMNTWSYHKTPKKLLKIENGKIVIIDENNNKVNIYHYTGDIGVINKEKTFDIISRMYFLTNDYFRLSSGFFVANKENVKDLWVNKHETPIYFAFKNFHYEGEIKCPKHYNYDFRKNISNLINVIFEENTNEESNIVFIISLMYDYIKELSYTLVGNNKYYKVLEILLDGKVNNNKLTIGYCEIDCVVNLEIKEINTTTSYHWFRDEKYKELKGMITEYYGDVSITTNFDKLSI
jgi:hypothetical protein